MNALRTNLIVKEIEQQVEDLVQVCNAYDGTHGEIKLDNSIQYYPEMNNLFLMFDEELLIGAIKLFGIFRKSKPMASGSCSMSLTPVRSAALNGLKRRI